MYFNNRVKINKIANLFLMNSLYIMKFCFYVYIMNNSIMRHFVMSYYHNSLLNESSTVFAPLLIKSFSISIIKDFPKNISSDEFS